MTPKYLHSLRSETVVDCKTKLTGTVFLFFVKRIAAVLDVDILKPVWVHQWLTLERDFWQVFELFDVGPTFPKAEIIGIEC